MMTLIETLVGFLFARALWHYVVVKSKAQNELPLVWLTLTIIYIGYVFLLIGGFIGTFFVIYAMNHK